MGKRKTRQDVENQFFDLVGDEYTILSEYECSKKPILIRHNKCSFEYKTLTSNFISQGCRCPKCKHKLKYTTETFKKKVSEISTGFTVLGEYKNVKTKIKMRHDTCGYIFDTLPINFLKGRRCAFCSGKYLNDELFHKKIDSFSDSDEYKFLEKYKGTTTKILVQHVTCGAIYKVTPHKFMSGERCPFCNEPHGEKEIRKWLEKHNISYQAQKKFEKCINKKELPFDFYLPNIKACIEFDGEQHFKEVEFFGGKKGLEKRMKNDSIKDEFCFDNGIKLIRIKFNENVNAILENEIIKERG